MRAVIPFSIMTGLAWNALVIALMGGGLRGQRSPSWMLAGAFAGLVAGLHAVWSYRRLGGRDGLAHGLAGYYLGMVAYWFALVVVERVRLCVNRGAWTDFDLRDHLVMIVWFLGYGTFLYGLVLIPLSFLTRRAVWWVHERFEPRSATSEPRPGGA